MDETQITLFGMPATPKTTTNPMGRKYGVGPEEKCFNCTHFITDYFFDDEHVDICRLREYTSHKPKFPKPIDETTPEKRPPRHFGHYRACRQYEKLRYQDE